MFIYLAILQISAALSCNSYRCSPKPLEEYKCIQYYNATTVYLQECPEGYACPASNLAQDAYCQKLGNDTDWAWPGEQCNEEMPCAYGTCEDSICRGKKEGESCKVHDECDPKLRCHGHKCVKQLNQYASGCTDDYDCTNDAGCDGGICRAYLSTEEASRVNVCNGNFSMICESTMCYSNFCLGFIKNDREITASCTSNSDCSSSYYSQDIFPIQFYTNCKCGYNPKATAYCDMFPGDSYKYEYLNKLKGFYSLGSNSYCNTVRRNSDSCIRSHLEEESYLELMYLKYRSELHPLIHKSDDCSRKIYLTFYDKIVEEMDKDDESDNWGRAIGISLIIVLMLI